MKKIAMSFAAFFVGCLIAPWVLGSIAWLIIKVAIYHRYFNFVMGIFGCASVSVG